MSISVKRSITIDAPIDKVWQVSAHEFDEIGTWSSGVQQSTAIDESPQLIDLEIPGRVCTTPQGQTFEKFIAYDEKHHHFTYEVSGGAMPSFIQQATNTWTMAVTEASKTELTMTVSMHLNPILKVLMFVPMRFQMAKILQDNLEELKHYIETGKVHPRKRASQNELELSAPV